MSDSCGMKKVINSLILTIMKYVKKEGVWDCQNFKRTETITIPSPPSYMCLLDEVKKIDQSLLPDQVIKNFMSNIREKSIEFIPFSNEINTIEMIDSYGNIKYYRGELSLKNMSLFCYAYVSDRGCGYIKLDKAQNDKLVFYYSSFTEI